MNKNEIIKELLDIICEFSEIGDGFATYFKQINKNKYSFTLWGDCSTFKDSHSLEIERVPRFMRQPIFCITVGHESSTWDRIESQIAPKDEMWQKVKEAFDVIVNNFEIKYKTRENLIAEYMMESLRLTIKKRADMIARTNATRSQKDWIK